MYAKSRYSENCFVNLKSGVNFQAASMRNHTKRKRVKRDLPVLDVDFDWVIQAIQFLCLIKGPNSINHLISVYFVIISIVHFKVFLHIFLSALVVFLFYCFHCLLFPFLQSNVGSSGSSGSDPNIEWWRKVALCVCVCVCVCEGEREMYISIFVHKS